MRPPAQIDSTGHVMRTDKPWGGRTTFYSEVVRVQIVFLSDSPKIRVERRSTYSQAKRAVKIFKDLSGFEQTSEVLVTRNLIVIGQKVEGSSHKV